VELANEFEAEIAKENLDNSMLLDDGSKMNVYFSNLICVNFSSSNSGGVGKYSYSFIIYKRKSSLFLYKYIFLIDYFGLQ